MFQAIVAIGVVYVIAPPTWEDLTHLALSGLADSSNEVRREGTDLVSVARELGLYWGHTFTSGVEGYRCMYACTVSTLW